MTPGFDGAGRPNVAAAVTTAPQEDGGTDLTQIALDAGFSSHSHFTAAFRRTLRVTPSAYARQARAARELQN